MSTALILVAILFTVFVAIRPFNLGKLVLNMATGSLLALAVLLLLKVIDLEMVKLGILGEELLKPWEIIVIFFTVAYASISTDITGIFDYLAYKIAHKAKGNGFKLFLFFYIFASILTVFTSNDIVILTLTPIIFYLGIHTKINVTPLLFAEFFGANALSMFLYIGNPTNIIIGNALGLGFLEYTQTMWLPTIIAAVVNFALLYFFFRKDMTKKYEIDESSTFTIRTWFGAILSSFLMLAMLGTLVFSQTLGVAIWVVTAIYAGIFILKDILFWTYFSIKEKRTNNLESIPTEKNEFWMTIKAMPWKILPFVLVFFILVQGLNEYGVIDWFATTMASFSTTLLSAIFVNGTVALVLANIINNQPMTIFLSSMLVSESFVVSETAFLGSAYAIIIASNLGANITLIGALAGLMWRNILENKGLKVTYVDFLKKGLIITPIVFVVTLTTLYFVLL